MIIEVMGDGVLVLNTQHCVIDLNPAMQRTLGRTASEVIGHPVAQVFSNWPEFTEHFLHLEEAQEEINKGNELGTCYYDARISPLYDQQGRLTGHVVVLREITRQKRAEMALRDSKRKIEGLSEVARQLEDCETEDAVLPISR